MIKHIIIAANLLLFLSGNLQAQNGLYAETPAWKNLLYENFSGATKSGEGIALQLPGEAVYSVPDGNKGFYQRGLITENDGTLDLRNFYGLRFDVQLLSDAMIDIFITIKIPEQKERHNLLDSSRAHIKVLGRGWHTVTVPFNSFDYNKGQFYFLKLIKTVAFAGDAGDVKSTLVLRNIRFIKGSPLKLEALVRSKPGMGDSVVHYEATITNSADHTEVVSLMFSHSGWEGMKAVVEPSAVILKSGEIRRLDISVSVPALAPQGSQETQTLLATTSTGGSSESLEFITLRKLEGPFLLHQEQGWKEILDKTKKFEWAKKSLFDYIKLADDFVVPEVPPGGINGEGSKAIYRGYTEQKLWPVAVAYKLTGLKKYGETIALFLNRLSDSGAYPSTLHANHQGIPQEGGFFEVCARSYDLIKDAGILTQKQKELIEETFRLYIYTVEDGLGNGGISNWSVFNLCPAAQCALVLQDLYHFNLLMNGSCGIKDHLKYGMMDDGWWYEMSLSYNLGCAQNMTTLGLAARPFGIDFLNERIPVALTQKVGLRPFEFENFLGMAFGKFGPVTNNYTTIKRMWDAIVNYPDYRSIMFGMGDGHEHEVGGANFELAYFAFRDTAFASVIKQGEQRDLLYGVPELPVNTPGLYSQSAHSDNAGIAVLRSQTTGRSARTQIQAAFKYGTHGSYHGHFDRLSLVSLMRYGRSFYNPETSWFGYGSYMYKWWVQPSISHNMVVVDGKQQEPVESNPLLFYSGSMMQVIGAETKARWSHPPYFGGYDQLEKVTNATMPYVPIVPDHPAVAAVTAYTEPILQRRLLIVTDDYVVTADYLKADNEHVFDNLLQLRGAKAGSNMKLQGQSARFDTSSLSSGQFITNVHKYVTDEIASVNSLMKIGKGKNWESGGQKSLSVPGELHIDAYNAWPRKSTLLIGCYAESWPINKKLRYEINGDGKLLATDSLGTWILGKDELSVNIKGIRNLQLKTFTNRGANILNTLFWANVVLVKGNGKQVPLSSLPITVSNIIPVSQEGRDYDNGTVQIAGTIYSNVLAAEPSDINSPGIINIDISNAGFVRLKATVGGDYPVGDEGQLRNTVSFRSSGKEATFLTVIEPYEKDKMVKAVKASNANTLEVALNDGRVQKIIITGLDSKETKTTVAIQEMKNGSLVREEKSVNP